MASFMISNYMRPNPILMSNSATFITDTAAVSLPLKPNQMIISTTRSCSKLSTSTNLASVWREIQGSNNWENLVEPLQPLLRAEIIWYGKFVTACYKAFDLDSTSKIYLSCKYGRRSMFQEVGLPDSGYEVTKYIYATVPDLGIIPMQPGSRSLARWVGYVAVSTDNETLKRLGRRDVLITFRGTVTNPEWIANLMSSLTVARLDPLDPRPEVKVEAGFLSLYTSDEGSATKFGVPSCREQLLCEVSRLINKYKGEDLSITLAGHSMGSSLALLLAYDISELGLNKGCKEVIPVTVFSFGGPRVGSLAFKERCDELGVKVLRIVNVNDPIAKLPGVLFNEHFKLRVLPRRFCPCYAHVGVELLLDFFKMDNPSCVHDLDTYIELLSSCSGRVQSKGIVGFSLLDRAKWLVFSTANALNLDGIQLANAASVMADILQILKVEADLVSIIMCIKEDLYRDGSIPYAPCNLLFYYHYHAYL